jgi:hypothetical protein
MSETETLRAQLECAKVEAAELRKKLFGADEMEAKIETLTAALHDFHWMARRYADNRLSYAPIMFNDHTRACIAAGVSFKGALFARDGMGRSLDRLTDEEVEEAERDMPHGLGLAEIRDEEMADLRRRLASADEGERALIAGEACEGKQEND